MRSNWTLHPENIHVKVDETKVTLTGSVSSFYQKDLAEKIACPPWYLVSGERAFNQTQNGTDSIVEIEKGVEMFPFLYNTFTLFFINEEKYENLTRKNKLQ